MHSTFQVFTDLAQFGALMLFIVLGFALAFYAMFGSMSASLPEGAAIEQYDTFFSSMLTLFGSMLGNFDFTVRSRGWGAEYMIALPHAAPYHILFSYRLLIVAAL